MPNHINIYTDGSSLGNPGPGGYAALIEFDNRKIEIKGNEPISTNNRMEMKAIIEALKWIKKENLIKNSLTVYSDSALLVNSLKFNWKRKANLDFWAELDEARKGLQVEYKWIKGHKGHLQNERCNDLAIAEAREIQRSKSPDSKTKKLKPDMEFKCQTCQKTSQGILSLLPDSKLIRVDCLFCKKFIKFAPKTKENKIRAKSRVLISKKQEKLIIDKLKKQGENIKENDLRELKKLTWKEAQKQINLQQKLF